MKKILLVVPDFHPVIGGAEIFATKLANYFSNTNNYRITVITRQPSFFSQKLNKINKTKIYEKYENICIVRVPYLEIRNIRVLSSVPFFVLMANIFNIIYRYDIIHYVGFFPSALIHNFMVKFKGQKSIYTEQGMILDVIRDSKNIYDVSPTLLKSAYKYFFKSVHTIVAVSINVKNKLNNYVNNKDVLLIPNGIDDILKPKIRYFGSNKNFNIITSSRLVEKNNIFFLVKEFHKILLKDYLNLSLHIYGDGEERCAIEDYINNNNLKKYIKLYGTVSHDVILEAYRKSDLFIRPSLTEGFGISFIEALAAGMPVIGSQAVESLGTYNSSCGSSVKFYSSGELANIIEKYLLDIDFYNNQSISAIEYSKNFMWASIFEKYEHIYKN